MFYNAFQKKAVIFGICSLFLSGTNLTAQEITKESEADDEPTIVIWETKVKSSSYLKQDEIANKQAEHISDLLRNIPGVDVGGAHSLNQRITIRSMDDKDLKITIDGANQNSYMYHHMGNLQIHADILKSVDIQVGTNSVLDGGLGGAVRFETKTAMELLAAGEDFGARVQVHYGTNSSTNYSVTGYGLLNENIDFLSYYNQVDRTNYQVGGNKILDSNGDVIAGTDGTVRGLKGELSDVLLKFGWNLGTEQRFELGYEKYEDDGNYSYRPDMGLATDLAITNNLNIPLLWPTKFSRNTITLNYDLDFAESSTLKATLFSNDSQLWRDETGYSQNPSFAKWAGIIRGDAKNTGFKLLARSSIGDETEHELTYGLERIKYNTDYTANYSAGLKKSIEKAVNSSLYIEDKISINEDFRIIPGIRYDNYKIDSKLTNQTFSDPSFALALEYDLSNDFLVKLSSTQLFKGPEVSEVFTGAGLTDRANSSIKAETGRNTELAFAYQLETNNNASFSLGTTLFKTTINNYIYDYAKVPGGTARERWKDNIGDMEVDGFEFYIGYTIGNFDTQLTYDSADSELNAFADYAALNKARLDRKQGNTIGANFSYELVEYGLSFNWEFLRVADLPHAPDLDGASLDKSKSGYQLHNFSLSWKPASIRNLTIIAGVDNVFDEFYASQASRTGVSSHPRFGELYLFDYEPGRNIKTTVAWRF